MKKAPFSIEDIKSLEKDYKTPFYIYDERAIRENARRFQEAFSWVPGGYKNFFAVKANPNPHILNILKEEAMGADCSSMAELVIAEKVGLSGEEIMFTSNNTPAEEFEKAQKLGAIINFDDIAHIEFFKKNIGPLPDLVSLRFNPGPLKSGNEIIGNPSDAKFGLRKDQLFEAYEILKKEGVSRFALHTMVVSNMLEMDYLLDTASMLFNLAVEIKDSLGIKIELINLGGGIGIPYRPGDKPVDIYKLGKSIETLYNDILVPAGLGSTKIVSENGRAILGPFGFLITKVRHKFSKYKDYIGVDANMSDLMRPGIYGAYHHVEVLGKESLEKNKIYDVVGSLCENNDKFAVDRSLPKEIEPGDYLVIFDAGAHGHAMGFNYNGKLRPAEFLLTEEGKFKLIRRAETLDDYFATIV